MSIQQTNPEAKIYDPKLLVGYHGDPLLKVSVMAQLEEHKRLDNIIQGLYWTGLKGCAVGCLIHGSDHREYERLFGIPTALAILEDNVFEKIQNLEFDFKGWPLKFMRAIDVGDTSLWKVWPRIFIQLFGDAEDTLQTKVLDALETYLKTGVIPDPVLVSHDLFYKIGRYQALRHIVLGLGTDPFYNPMTYYSHVQYSVGIASKWNWELVADLLIKELES